MGRHDIRRAFKRPPISDQQKRRDLSLLRQNQNRRDAQHQARCLASTVVSLPNQNSEPVPEHFELLPEPEINEPDVQLSEADAQISEAQAQSSSRELDIRNASKLRGPEVRMWFAKQLMLPEWMIDVPDRLNIDWYVFARPSGKRCFVVSLNGTTISRLRNGSLLHRFPSALPNGSRKKGGGSGQSYTILDCIFHELDQTYYVIDMVCWAGVSFYECTAEFRFFWLNNKILETGACEAPSQYHRYRFSLLTIYNCDYEGLNTAYTGSVPYVKDGLAFYNKNAHYQTGNTPLALVWKDENCSQYVIDTDGKGQIPHHQQVALELQGDGKLTTSDDPPVVFGCLNKEFIEKSELHHGNLLRFSVGDGGLNFLDGKVDKADLQYLGKVNRARAFADTYSKVVFQHMVRHSPLRKEHLFASVSSSYDQDEVHDVDMIV